MRAERLLSLILLLRTQGQMPARSLAQSLNVSERTIYRDVETLSLAGIPIYTIEGRGGGIGLDDSYRVSLAGLNIQEVQALFVSGSSAPLQDLGLATANQQTLLKLLDILPALHRAEADRIRQRIYIDATDWFSSGSSTPLIPQVQEAVLGDCVVEISYQRTNGEIFQRTIHAYGMVAKASVWYLVGAHDGQFRTYRVSRIQTLRLTGEKFMREPDFDLMKVWQGNLQSFFDSLPQYPVTLHIRAERQKWVSGVLSLESSQLSPTDDADWLAVTVLFDTQEQALTALLGIAHDIRIIAPADLLPALQTFARTTASWLDEH